MAAHLAARGLGVVTAVVLAGSLGVVVGPVGVAVAAPASCKDAGVVFEPSSPPALARLGASAAQTQATGAGVLVAVVDSGVDVTNLHLRSATVPGIDLVGGQADRTGTVDTYGHGTAVAGEIAARPVPGSGVVGLAPQASILPVRVYVSDDPATTDPKPSTGLIASGIRYSADRGAKIINVSLSSTTNDPALEQSIAYATARGSLVVASAGNRTTSDDKTNDPRYPAAYDGVLAVAATDASDAVTDDSIHGSYVGVAAPGTNVLTAFAGGGDCTIGQDSTSAITTATASTSYATGYVSAAAALVAQRYPDETPAQWKYRLEVTASRTQPSQRNDYSGWGIVQPYEALTFVADGLAAGPPDPAASPQVTPSARVRTIPGAVAVEPDPTARNQALWLGLGGVVVALALALAALLRRDRRPVSRRPADAR